MKKIYNKSVNSKLAAYSSMAAALTIAATSADAQVIYHDIDDELVEASADYDFFSLDMDENGTIDFVFRAGIVYSAASAPWTFGSIFGMYDALSAGNPDNQAVGTAGPLLTYASALNAGYSVKAGDDFVANDTSNVAVLASVYYSGSVYGQFGDAGPKFIALKFDADGDTHYGWIRVDVTLTPITITVMDYAYQASADAGIETGDTTGLPIAVNTLSESIKSIYSHGNIIHINLQNAEDMQVNILNVTGQKVYGNTITDLNNEIVMNNLPDGNYIVELINDKGIYSKTVYLSR